MIKITITTCWYIVKSKQTPVNYIPWIINLFSIANNFNLVVYTDTNSYNFLRQFVNEQNEQIKLIIKPMEEFRTFKYKYFWISNHKNSHLRLHEYTDWQLNMLWCEKIFLVNETIQNKYYETEYYGWCDIGYFRNRHNDLNTTQLINWPKIIEQTNKIHYGCVQKNQISYCQLSNDIKNHYKYKLETPPTYKYEEICFAGGFFYGVEKLLSRYAELFDKKIQYYFSNNFIIKDDQSIVMDIIFTNPDLFYIHFENDIRFDNWFMFQRLLN